MALILTLLNGANAYSQRLITFCNEPIPVERQAVAGKLMNVIKRYIPTLNQNQLRQAIQVYLPYIESRLIAYGLPTDFKYLPIVESHFQLLTSRVGAKGFWQFMPATAADYNLVINDIIDEREDFYKSTEAACKLIKNYYNFIKQTHRISSWTLTAAAYNFGNGNISNAIRRMGGDYFNMALNEETALYVYKIIAVKELLERPDLYIGNLGTNIFAYAAATPPTPGKNSKTPPPPATPIYTVSQPVTAATSLNNEEQEFTSLTVHTDEEDKPSIVPPAQIKPARYQYYKISLADNYNQFTDGMLVEIILHENFSFIGGGYTKNSKLTAKCYQYEDRAMLYLGDPAMSIVSPDADGALTLGIPIKDLRKRSAIMLKVEQ